MNHEIEYVFIGKIANLGDLKKASKFEVQEQWEIKTMRGTPGGGAVRVRSYNGNKFELTLKAYDRSDEKVLKAEEKDIPIDKQTFELFKKLAPMGYIKERFFFPIKGSSLVWEFDVYRDKKERYIPWCKIDLEIPNASVKVPEFPIELAEVISNPRTPEQEVFVRNLFVNEFTIYKKDNILPIDYVDNN